MNHNCNGNDKKTAYICGPLTELPDCQQSSVKNFYSLIADMYKLVTGKRAFVPHEHYDPIRHANFSPTQVDAAERRQVCELTTILVVVAIAPSWGGGIEVEMAQRSNVPVVIMRPKNKVISRLLRGNPAVVNVIDYDHEADALDLIRKKFSCLLPTV